MKESRKKKRQRIIVAGIAVLIALIMILGTVLQFFG